MMSKSFNAVGWFGDGGIVLSAKCTLCGQSLKIIEPRMPNIRLEAHNCPNQKYDEMTISQLAWRLMLSGFMAAIRDWSSQVIQDIKEGAGLSKNTTSQE